MGKGKPSHHIDEKTKEFVLTREVRIPLSDVDSMESYLNTLRVELRKTLDEINGLKTKAIKLYERIKEIESEVERGENDESTSR